MKTRWFIIASVILISIAATAVGCDTLSPPSSPEASSALSGIFNQQSTGIWVTGQGKVTAVPDTAILSLGVEAQAQTVADAQNQAATAMTAVMNELDNFGIAEKDIQTQQFSIYPVRTWSEEKGEEVLIGYRVANTITVKVRNIEDTANIIDATARAGGDLIRINSISFTVDEPSQYYQQVRDMAMADAQGKAKQLAELGGVKLGKPNYINEGSISIPVQRTDFNVAAPVPAPAAPSTPISPGEMEITLSVQVVYSIE
jgi:uncharacterized protein YggE